MLIWLGKNRLSQAEKVENQVTINLSEQIVQTEEGWNENSTGSKELTEESEMDA